MFYLVGSTPHLESKRSFNSFSCFAFSHACRMFQRCADLPFSLADYTPIQAPLIKVLDYKPEVCVLHFDGQCHKLTLHLIGL